MSHHSSSSSPEHRAIMEKLREGMSEINRDVFGEYPNGKLNAQDEGALACAVGREGRVIKLLFPKPVAWIGFTPEQAVQLAQDLIKHARNAGFSRAVSLTF